MEDSEGEFVGGDKEEARQTHRSSLKSHISFNNYARWRHKLRENCFERVRSDRTRLLWKLRLSEVKDLSFNDKSLVKSTLQDVVVDELRKIKQSSLHENHGAPSYDANADDMIWDDDVFPKNYEGDYEEMLLQMQNIFYEDLRKEEFRKEKFVDTWEDDEDEYLARVLCEHMHLNGEQVEKVVWCPICKSGRLQENFHHIYCSQCELKLARGDEVNLNSLSHRLGEAYTEHFDRGCRMSPEFCTETKFCLTALYIKCPCCSTFEVVL